MLKKLVRIASSRRTKFILFGLWVLSLVSMLRHGWVWVDAEDAASGKYRYDFFEIRRTPLFVWLTLILVAYLAHRFRQRSLGYYGLCEVLFGLIGGITILSKFLLDQADAWIALAASAFVIVRGATNISLALAAEEASDFPTSRKATDDAKERMATPEATNTSTANAQSGRPSDGGSPP